MRRGKGHSIMMRRAYATADPAPTGRNGQVGAQRHAVQRPAAGRQDERGTQERKVVNFSSTAAAGRQSA
jgi:hypothetical protein